MPLAASQSAQPQVIDLDAAAAASHKESSLAAADLSVI
jgi:hypothetical protein